MSIESNKAVFRRFEEEVHNQGKLDVIDEVIGESYLNHGPNGTQELSREQLKSTIRSMRTTSPDLHDELHEVIAEGDYVAARLTRSATFTGKLRDIEPTHRHTELSWFHLARLERGRIVELWWVGDTAGLEKWFGTYGSEKT